MLATFCLRLACGMIAALLLVSPEQVNPRFYRVQFLTALGLSALSIVFLRDLPAANEVWLWIALGAAILGAFLGSLSWSLNGAPAGRTLIAVTAVALVVVLGLIVDPSSSQSGRISLFAGSFSSAAVLGSAMTAMLMGHSYLVAPSMSMTPLLRLLVGLFVATAVRGVVCGVALSSWTSEHSLVTLNDVTILLPLRWGLGIFGPLLLGVMAWHTARIRSTQSATGILYVVVIFCFLGELISEVLFRFTGGYML